MSKCHICLDKEPILLKSADQCDKFAVYYVYYAVYCGSYFYCHDQDTDGALLDEDAIAVLDPGFRLQLQRFVKVDDSLSAINTHIQSSNKRLTKLEKKFIL